MSFQDYEYDKNDGRSKQRPYNPPWPASKICYTDAMKCQKCGDTLRDNVIYRFMDKSVCDDCYIDLMIGVPEIDFSRLPSEFQSAASRFRKSWNRDRPTRHHFLNFE